MEAEEEENSNPSQEIENETKLTTTITPEMDTQQHNLRITESSQCERESESVAELHDSQLGIGGTELQPPPPPSPSPQEPQQSEMETVLLEKSEGREFGRSGNRESQPVPPPVTTQPPAIEGSKVEEKEESQRVEPLPQVRNLVAGVDSREIINEDVNENLSAASNETEAEMEGVADVSVELETDTLNRELEAKTSSEGVESVEDRVNEAKEESARKENLKNIENAEAVERGENADVIDKVEVENVEEDDPTLKVEEEEKMGQAEVSGVGNKIKAVEQRRTAEIVEQVKMEKTEVVDVVEEMVGSSQIEMTKVREEEKAEKMEVTDEAEKKQADGQVGINEIAEEAGEAEQIETTDVAEEKKLPENIEMPDVSMGTEAAEDLEDAINETEEMKESEMADGEDDGDKEEDVEMEMGEKGNEGEDLADEMEGAEEEAEEVSRSGGGKRKRGTNAKPPSRAPSKKKMEEDVCFICFDGGELVLCDRRGCPKAYHPSCVNRDEAFFRAKGRWNCGWHLCSNCEKNAHYMCYTCTFSLCKGCIKGAVILCVRGNKGFCETCMKTVMLIERNEQGNKETGQVDFDDRSSWEYLFKDYWTDLKERLSLTSEELAQAKNPWKGSDSHGGRQQSPDELYDAHDDGSGSDSSENAEVSASKRRKPKKRLKSRTKARNSPGSASVVGAGGEYADESVEWASKELLEFVMHMKNGDKSACSQFDVQALLLEYIKRNKLRDPRRKSQIICDSRLENLFGKPRVGHFEMLKLLEAHFLLKDDSQADDLPGSVVDTESNQLEADGNSDTLTKASKGRKRKSRKKGEGRGLQSNLDDYAAIDMHNINLIYLRRSLLEDLIEDSETFHDKVVGSFVRIRISGSTQKQDLYRLVQVIGTSKSAEPYRVGKKTTDFMLEILNLNKTELVSIDIISNQEFTEDECKRLRQSIKCGLINRLTVGDIQEKAIAIQAARVKDSLESEITRVSHLRDRASDMGRRKELRECVEKLQLLKSPEERQRRLEEIPEIHSDPNMDPSHESDEDKDEREDKRQENSLRPRGSGFSSRGREPISPSKGGYTANDTWGGSKIYSSMNRELSRNMSDKGFTNKTDVGAGETVNENLWGQGREKQTRQGWDTPKTSSNTSQTSNSTVVSEPHTRNVPDISPATPSTGVTHPTAKVNETEKSWHYQDPAGKIQGPFSMVQLRKWSNTGYFPTDLRIWKNNETKDDSILLTDSLAGNFQRDPPALDDSFLKTQLVQSPRLPSSYSGNAVQAASAPIEVPKYSTDRWGSGTNLPSPTPGQTATSATKGQVFESQWSPTPAQPMGSGLGANQSSGGNSEVQRAGVVISGSGQLSHSMTPSSSTKPSGHLDGSKISHGVSPMRKQEMGMLLSPANAPRMHSQSTVPGESPKIEVNSDLLPATDCTGVSVNAAVDMRGLQNSVQPVTSSSIVVGTHGWGPGPTRPEMGVTHAGPGAGSQACGGTASQPEANNLVPMPSQPNAYGNWGSAPTSVQNTIGNPSGVSAMPGTNPWRAPVPGPSNIQHSAPSSGSSGPWGVGIADNQNVTPRQGPEIQSTGWGPIPGNQNMGWCVSLPANSNQGWVAPGQAPAVGNANPSWGVPSQGQAPGNVNPGWGAPVQGQGPGNAFSGWGPSGQGSAPAANTARVPPGQGQAPGNANTSWSAPAGKAGTWGSDVNQNGDRFSGQKDRGSHGGDSSYGGGRPWQRQSSFSRSGDSSRASFKGQRVCKFHENGHCKKGASCDYMHT